MKVLLASECGRKKGFFRRATIENARAENGVCASRKSRENGVVGLCYDSLSNGNPGRELLSRRHYEKGYTEATGYREATADSLWRLVADLGRNFLVNKSQVYSFIVVSAPFSAMHYISDPRYLFAIREGAKRMKVRARKPNVYFTASRKVSRGDFRKHELIQLIVLRNIKVGRELSVQHGEKFLL